MAIYLLTLLFILLLAGVVHPNRNNKRKKKFIVISFALLILVSGLRKYTVGIDLEFYYYNSFIQYLEGWSWNDYSHSVYEVGYFLLNIAIGTVTHNPQMFIAITSFIIFGLMGRFIYKYSENTTLSVFLFITLQFWFMFLNIIRQGLAVAIVLIASEFLINKKLGKIRYIFFCLIILLAAQFHNSALVALILLPIYFLKFQKKEVLWSIIAVVSAVILYERIFTILAGFINHRDYVGAYLLKGEADSGLSTYVSITIYALVFLGGILKLVTRRTNEAQTIITRQNYSDDFLMFTALLVLITKVLSLKVTIIGRVSYFFMPYMWLLIPRIINRISFRNRKYINFAVYVVCLIMFVVMGYFRGGVLYGTVPYLFFWQ